MGWFRRHALLLALIALWLVTIVVGMYGDWIVYSNDASDHGTKATYSDFLLTEWGGIQFAMNFQSEILGIITLVIFKDAIKKWWGGEPHPDEEEA